MKKYLIFWVSLALWSAAVQADTIRAAVNGMVCAFCAQGIEKNLQSTGKTKDIFISLKQKVIAAELKEGQTLTHDDFKALVQDSGYTVTKIETVKLSANDIRNATKK